MLFSFFVPYIRDQLLKERIHSQRSKCFSLRVDSISDVLIFWGSKQAVKEVISPGQKKKKKKDWWKNIEMCTHTP